MGPASISSVPGVRKAASDLVRSLRRALLFLTLAVVSVSSLLFTNLVDSGQPTSYMVFYTAVCWLWVVTGVFAWWRRPSNGMGALMVWGGITLNLAAASSSAAIPVATVGAVFATAPLSVMVHLLHAFPSGRVRGRASRLTVIAGYLVCFVLQIPLYAFDPAAAGLPWFVADRPDLLEIGTVVQALSGTAVMVATTVILAVRLRRAQPFQRRVLIPLFGYGLLAVLWIPLSANLLGRFFGMPFDVVILTQLVVIAGIPVAFAAAVFRGGFARTGELQELSTWLGSGDDQRSELGGALSSVLGDPSLELAFRVAGQQRWVDAAGTTVELPAESRADRAWVGIELSGSTIAAIVYDADLIDDPELVRAAGRVVALGVDRERLTAALRVSEQSLRRSRERIVRTADQERRRIAQDLHDGLQVKLVLLALDAQQVANSLDIGSEPRDHATELRQRIDAAAAELRALVHAVMPSSLVERGLVAATEDLLDRLPIRSSLRLADIGPLPLAIQSTAYFVVAEAVANVIKHAGARRVSVDLTVRDGTLTVEIEDDGCGGAAIENGTGIRGLVDRADVLGGRLILVSTPGAGTLMTAVLPLDLPAGARPAFPTGDPGP
ncbi:sensor histidine kinase [Nakamurella flava]|uniref:histidine kinase n=1 Tax=Nakamurella flava TaxID=2576308 RepID=A0A4U6QKB5_9ACTN|nr:histidine kinase [Nakamurella flava]TKV60761.1 sensor histidine kinase [Nakamurella flava]